MNIINSIAGGSSMTLLWVLLSHSIRTPNLAQWECMKLCTLCTECMKLCTTQVKQNVSKPIILCQKGQPSPDVIKLFHLPLSLQRTLPEVIYHMESLGRKGLINLMAQSIA